MSGTRASRVVLAAVAILTLALATSVRGQWQPSKPRLRPSLTSLLLNPVGPPALQGKPAGLAPAAKDSASITGVVTAADTGQPVGRAHVTLTASELPSPVVTMTDDEGRYVFTGLGAGRYTVTASKSGYFETIFGQKVPPHPGTPVSLASGQIIEHVDLRLPKGGVIAGQIVDEHGNPVPDIEIRAMRRDWAGERQLVVQATAMTDDRGQYRVHNLPSSAYFILAVPKMDTDASPAPGGRGGGGRGQPPPAVPLPSTTDQPRLDYPKLFFPGTVSASEATSVTVGLGEERQGIDVRLRLVPMAKLSGTIVGLEGLGRASSSFNITASESGGVVAPGSRAQGPGLATAAITSFGITSEDAEPGQPFASGSGARFGDRFSFDSVPPGRYTIRVVGVSRTPGSSPPVAFWGELSVVVDGHDQDQLLLAMQPGSTMTGRLTADPSALGTPAFDQMQVRLTAAGGGRDVARVVPDTTGRFTIPGVVPGAYTLTVSGPGAWTAASELVGGKDALDFGLQVRADDRLDDVVVVLTDRSTEVRGTLQDAKGQAISGYTVVVFAADSRYWVPLGRRIQSTRPSTDGAFRVPGLPPGDYFIAVATDLEPSQLYEPAVLQELKRGAMPLHLADGDRKEQVLRIGGQN
jgi:hypothetical protein